MTTVRTALILAAGRGSRLGGLTEESPKCLVPLGGRPLLEWQMDALRGGGVERVVAVCGYRCEAIASRGVETVLNPDWATTQMVASLLCARDVLDDGPVIVSYSDIVYSAEIVRRLAAEPGPLSFTYDADWLALWEERFDDPLSDAESFRLGPDGSVVEIGNRARDTSDIEGQYMGLLKIGPEALGWIDEVLASRPEPDALARMDMTSLLSALVAGGRRITAVPASGGWCEVDSPRDLAVAERWLAEGRLGIAP